MEQKKYYSLKFVLTLVIVSSALAAVLSALVLIFHYESPEGLQSVISENRDRENNERIRNNNRNNNNQNRDNIDNNNNSNSSGGGRTQAIEDLIDVIEDRFIGTFDLDAFIAYAMRGGVASLDDHWSHYMTPEEYAHHLESINNQFVGIGVEVLIDDDTDGVRVMNVHRGSGAYDAGILAGDIIVEVDGECVIGYTLDELRALLRRPIDDTALIGVLRDGELLHLTVVYRVVFVDPVSYKMLDGNIGYVSVRNFDVGAANGFISAVEYLMSQGAVGFIYDVRSNPGGRLDEMSAILDFLLPEGIIFISVSTSGDEQTIMSDGNYIDMPAVVLVNSHSFSAAEYFAALLTEYYYAYTVGEQTTGKNRLQNTIPLPCGGAVVLSTGEYLTKNRVSLYDEGGYTPLHIIELTDEEYLLFRRGELEFEDDPQLQLALSLLTN